MNVPNLISLSRIALSLLIVWLLQEQNYGWALALFVIACIADGADGFLARYLNQETELGAILDPLAGKVMINAPIVVLTLSGQLPIWFCLIILGRDIGIVLGYLGLKGIGRLDLAKPSGLGKFTTSIQMVFMMFFFWTLFRTSNLEVFIPMIALACAALTVLSGAFYLWGITKHLIRKD